MKKKLAAIYSIDEKITGKKLSSVNINNYDKEIIQSFFEWCKKYNIKNLLGKDIKWKIMKPIPYILYYKGNIKLLDKKIIGIVGPRDCSNYAKSILENFFEEIKGYSDQFVTISGMADGIDKLCHNLSIKYNIPTIAVLGGGLGHYINSTDRYLIKDIERNGGLIISEFKIKFRPTNWSFPQRNRLIAGFSDILFVPQAKKKSGSLITVNFAHKWDIPIYSCFSHIFDKNGNGSNELIEKKQITGINDLEKFIITIRKVLKLDKISSQDKIEKEKFVGNQKKIIDYILKNNNSTIENISYGTGLSIQELLQEVSELEIIGVIKEESNGTINLY